MSGSRASSARSASGSSCRRRSRGAAGHATELARERAADADAIVVFAGDGTYNEALNGADGARAVRVPAGRRDERPAARARRCRATRSRPRARSPRRSPSGARAGSRSGSVNGRRFCFSAGARLRRRGGAAARPARPRRRRARGRATLAFVRNGREDDRSSAAAGGVPRRSRSRASDGPRSSSSRTATRTRTPVAVALHVAPDARSRRARLRRTRATFAPATCRGSLGYMVRGQRAARGGGHRAPATTSTGSSSCDRPLPLQADGEDLGDVDRGRVRGEARRGLSFSV